DDEIHYYQQATGSGSFSCGGSYGQDTFCDFCYGRGRRDYSHIAARPCRRCVLDTISVHRSHDERPPSWCHQQPDRRQPQGDGAPHQQYPAASRQHYGQEASGDGRLVVQASSRGCPRAGSGRQSQAGALAILIAHVDQVTALTFCFGSDKRANRERQSSPLDLRSRKRKDEHNSPNTPAEARRNRSKYYSRRRSSDGTTERLGVQDRDNTENRAPVFQVFNPPAFNGHNPPLVWFCAVIVYDPIYRTRIGRPEAARQVFRLECTPFNQAPGSC
ncbi:unnamed protein product, partial [Pylaiella littoralis]